MFRSISNTSQNPAAQVEFDATYGIFYGYVWGSNTDFGENIELDYGLGITPKWGNVTFNFAGLYYTFPGAEQRNRLFRGVGRRELDQRRVDPWRQGLLVAG